MTDKLKPCPFCGGEAEMIFWEAMKDARVRCKACDVSTHDYRTPEEAIEAWNKRTSSPIYGRWILYEDEDTNAWKCSACHKTQQLMNGTPFENNWYYCPSCGAKMESELRA